MIVSPGTTGAIYDNYSVVAPFNRMYVFSPENTQYYLTLGTCNTNGALIHIRRIGDFSSSTFTINYNDPFGNPQNVYSNTSTVGALSLVASGNTGFISTTFMFYGSYNTGRWYQL